MEMRFFFLKESEAKHLVQNWIAHNFQEKTWQVLGDQVLGESLIKVFLKFLTHNFILSTLLLML